MNRTRLLLASLLAILGTSLAQAQATVPTEISDMTTNASTVWTSVKAIVIGVVGTFILLRFVKLVGKR